MISAIIIEDNIEAQEYLTDIIKNNFPIIQILGYASSIKTSIQLINESNPELVFMDIELTDGLSFEIFDAIEQPSFEVIFITAFQNYLQKALDHFALNYITKPINPPKLIGSIGHYLQLKERLFSLEKFELFKNLTQNKNGQLFIQSSNEHILVKTANIIKLDADGNYTYLLLEDGRKLLASKSLKYYESLLPETSFFRAHRSVIVNINHIVSIYKKETIILTNKDKIHVSTRNKNKLIQLIQLLS
ncbi:DNA-binding response regulator [Dokdonia pacifica]|uniref:Two component transcriptional regulator, LytTR family n=1 Tax=Dokdonia pacifica TaxID=1627892 RepID=A0A239BIR5_9FLAO|nr:LytTR family DNA-binding domain-containing protein [Dokdonia pacifica]GGG29066.1 DNA-binding response regulator [Dokdonia pacifica]SNS08047.1 two component transcriptional regulator, LytTR family [Dokdonia pacifica]